MGIDAWITVVVLALTLGLLAWDRVPPAGVVLAGTVTLLITNVIDASQAFSGFSNPAPITVAALYILAAAAQKTGLLSPLTTRVLGEGTERGALARLIVPAAGASAFINNTPLVAMLIPDVVAWAQRKHQVVSRFLLPLSFATILGGTVTLIGTSTNLVISGLLEESGAEPLGMFEITPIGLPVAVAGLAVILLVVGRLVPERRSMSDRAEQEIREFTVDMQVVEGGPLDGRTVTEAGLRDLAGVFLVEIDRGGHSIAPVAPDTLLEGGDRLIFAGRVDQIVDLQRTPGLRSAEHQHLVAVESPSHTFYEAVVGRSSPLAGSTLKDTEFRGRYQAAVVAIHRDGQRVRAKLGQVRLRPGDTLLVLAGPGFYRRWRDSRDFLLIARLGGPPPTATRNAPLVGIIAVLMILLAAFDVVPILEGSLLAAAALVLTRVLTVGEARDAIDLDVIVLIGAAFGLGAAIESTGLAEDLAELFVSTFDGLGTAGIVLGVALATVMLTELITNNAAAVVVFPIAVSVAAASGFDPRTMALVVAISASCSFLTPIGYQTNTMVYGPGGYRFSDYIRVGVPLTVTVLAVATAAAMIKG